MFKQLYATGAFCLTVMLGIAQETLSVKVTDNKSIAIPGATVYVEGKSKQTNADGSVSFVVKDNHAARVTVRFLGFQEFRTTLNQGQHTVLIQLQPDQNIMADAFVYASRAKDNSATTFKNINKSEIRRNNLGRDIPYLLDQTPGVVVGSDAGAGIGYTNMTIRGSDNARINVTLNGIPLNDAESMGSFFVNLPDFASSVESIQVQRGIGTSTNGAGAFGASLNIQTDALEASPYAEFNNSFGSYNSWKNTLKVGSGLLNNKYAFNARLSRISSDGYIERASSDLKSFYVDGGLYTEKHTLKATVFSGKEKTYQAWYGTAEPLLTGDKAELQRYANDSFWLFSGPEYDRFMQGDRKYNYYTYPNQTDNYTQTHAHLQYSGQWASDLRVNAALHYTRGAGYFEEFKAGAKFSEYGLENVTLGDTTLKKTDLIRRRWLDNHFYGGTYSINYKPSQAFNIILGGAYNQYKGDHYGEITWAQYASNGSLGDKYYLNNAVKNDFNTYLKADYRLDKWLLNVDLQYRNVTYKVDGNDNKIKNIHISDNLNFINPKAGVTYFINPASHVYASYAYAGKEPIRKDYIENPNNLFPKPEKMQDIEAGYRFKNESFNIGANLYAMLYKNQLVQTGSLNDTGSALRVNVPKSYRTGIEIDGAWNISSQFLWSATAALSRNKIKDFVEMVPVLDKNGNKVSEKAFNYDNTDIAKSPAAVLSNNFTYRPMEALSISFLSKYISRMYLDNTSAKERSIKPSFVNNIAANYTFKALGIERIDLNLAVNNIFNTKFTTNGYTYSQILESKGSREYFNFYYPQATTNFMLGLNLRF
ncbi:TonB-dependent receptor [Sphingobacterium sp. Mn56C]|uniref:TonB-dependent receptor n=1 Tax=Sphingobacterium sp. Mn56C TaxID=3395261 RepID=UPI003BBE93D3